MIYCRPRDTITDPGLLQVMDEEGWFPLKSTCGLVAEDFKYMSVRINGVVYEEPSDEFWAEYEKAFAWVKLQL